MEQAANEARELATSLRIMIELVRDAYWEQIDRTDNESMDSATVVAKRLNDAIAEVDATLHSVDLAVALIEEQMARRAAANAGVRRLFHDDIDEDSEIDDTSVVSANASASEQLAALTTAAPMPVGLEDAPLPAYKRREVKYKTTRVRDGVSPLEEGVWYNLDQDFAYTKPIALRMGELEFHGLPNWRSAYIRVLRELARRDADTFAALADRKFGTHRRAMFTKKGGLLINPQKIGALYVETNLSATGIASATTTLADMFGVEGPLQVQIRRTGIASTDD